MVVGVIVGICDGSYGVIGIDGVEDGAVETGVSVWWYNWLPIWSVSVWAFDGDGFGV